MAEERTRVALIGAGVLANRYHYPSIAEMPDVTIEAVCDLVEEKARQAAARFGIPRIYTDYRRMLAEVEPDAVYVIMPPQHLYEPAHTVLTQGRHLFVEKPLALTATQARMLNYTAGVHGCLTMVGFQRRFIPAAVTLRKRVEERGSIHFAAVSFMKSTVDLSIPAGFYDGAIDPLTSDGIHAVDNLRWLCGGEVEEVWADVRRRCVQGPVPNAFFATVRFSSGAMGTVHYNTVTGRRIFRSEFHGPNITAYVDADRESFIVMDDGEPEIAPSASFLHENQHAARERRPEHWLGFWNEHRHFIDCVRSGTQPSSYFGDAVKSMELVERILASSPG